MIRANAVRGVAVCAVMLFAVPLFAATFTSAQSGDWGTASTWGGSVPVTGDSVVITSNHVVTVTDNRVIDGVTLDSTAGNKMLVVQTGGTLLVERAIPPAITINAPSPGSTNIVRMDGGTLDVSNAGISITGGTSASKLEYTALGGNVFIAGDLTFAGTIANAIVDFGASAGTINLGGDLGSGGTIVNSASSVITLDGTGAQTINSYTFRDLTVNKAGGTATLNGPITVTGDFDLTQGVFDDGGYQISLNGAGTSTTLVGSLGVLKLGSAGNATSFPTPHGTVLLSNGSAVVYQAGATQTIQSDFSYQRLYLSTMGGAVNKILSGASLTVNEELNISDNGANVVNLSLGTGALDANADISGDGSIFVSSGSITVAGNMSNLLTLSAGASSGVTFDGSGAQQVLAATYGNLTINKSAGTATLAGNTTVNTTLSVAAGTLDAGANIVTLLGNLTINASAAFSATAASVKFNGTSTQTFSSALGVLNVGTLEVNNANGVNVSGDVAVGTSLVLNGGKLTTTGDLFADVLATITRTSGWIVGRHTIGFNPTPARTFHIGTSAAYMPVTVDAGSAGTVAIEAREGLHPNRTGINLLNRYWDFDNSSSATPLDSITFNYNQTDFSNGDETKFHLARYDGGVWTQYGDVVTEATNIATATSVAPYTGDWVIGQRGSLGAAGVLAITSVNGGSDPNTATPFAVAIQSRYDNGTAANVTANTGVSLSVLAGAGPLGGTTTGTINAGSSSTTISGVTYGTAENGVVLRASQTSGDPLDYGDSTIFNVTNAPSTLTVSSINDSGPGTLRDAITTLNANGCAQPCTINFSTSGNIVLSTALPAITRDDVTIDGFTAPGASANTNSFGQPSNAVLTVSIDGGNTVNTGFDVQASLVKIQGFAIKGFTNAGVVFSGTTTSSNVGGCYIGTDLTGQLSAGNAAGVHFAASVGATAGGFTAASRNVISGNTTWGVITSGAATGVALYGNYIGTKADLSGALANNTGVKIDTGAAGANIGAASSGNVISGNTASGLVLAASNNVVKGNYIGIAGSSGNALGNTTGIQIDAGSTFNTIGGPSPTEINTIGSNSQNGILINGDDNTIDDNVIGIAPDGVTARGNGGSGIRIDNTASRNIIGTSLGNKIANNANDGVTITGTGLGNTVRKSRVSANTSRAIDLGDDGLTNNDATDSDTGPNNKQNFPTLSEAKYLAGNINVTLSLNSSGGVNVNFLTFDVFKADAGGQAGEYLGNSGCVAGSVFANLQFSVPAGSAVVNDNVVATATAYSDAACTTPSEGTSEVSATTRVGGAVHWINASGGAWETAANWNPATVPTTGDDAYIDANGTYTVTINSNASIGALLHGAASGTQTLIINASQSLSIADASSVSANAILEHGGSNLGGAGALSVSGTLNWNSGSIIGAGGVSLQSGSTLNINAVATKTLNGPILTISSGATANWLNGAINMANGGHVDNFGTFDVKCDATLANSGLAGTFDNLGTLRKSTTSGTTNFTSITLNHTGGTFDIQTGTMNISAGTASAPIAISVGAVLYIDDSTFTLGTGANTTGAGKIHINGGTLAVSGSPVTIEHVALDSGALSGTGIATTSSTGAWLWNGGTMTGGGTTQIENGAVLQISSASGKSLNNRTISVQSGGSVTINGSGNIAMSNGGTIANTGTVDVTVDMTISDAGSDGGITNSGLFKKSAGAGTLALTSVDFTNNATLRVLSGTLNPALVNSTGAIELNPGTLLIDDNTVTLSGGSDLFGAGLVQIAGGTLTMNAADTLPNVQLDSGTLNGTANVPVTALAWNGGTMSGSGTTTIPASATATVVTSSAKNLQRTLSIASTGQVLVTGSGTINLASGGNIANAGLFDLQTDVTISDAGGDGGINNTNLFRKSGGLGTASITSVDFTNSGDLQVQSGTLNPTLINSIGNIQVSTNCTLLVDDSTVTLTAGDVSGAGLVRIAGGTVIADANDTFPNVQLDSGTLNGSAVATITSLTWNGGTMAGTGTTTIPASATATIATAAAKNLQRTLSIANTGTVTVTGTGAINLASGGNIANDGTLEVTAAVTIGDAGFGGDINNTRTFRSNHAGNTTLAAVTLNNTGASAVVDVPQGTLDLADGVSSGAFTIGGAVLVNSDTYNLATGTTVSGAGAVNLTGGTLLVSGNVSMPALNQNGGTIDGSGTLTLTGSSTWTTGTMLGGGTTAVGSTGTFTLNSVSAKALNNRTLSVIAGGTVSLAGGGTINLANGGNIANAGAFNVTADNAFNDTGSGGGFVNTGTFTKSVATGTTTFFSTVFTNNGGLVDLQSGILAVNGDVFTQAPGSTLKLWLNGTTPGTGFAQVTTNTTPNLAGTLEIALVGPYQPAGGDTFRVLSATAHSGDFTQPYTYPVLANSRTFSDAYDASGLLLTVNGNADLSISKTAPSNVTAGNPIAYTLTVNNAGPDVANSVSVTDVLQTGHTGISASGTGWTCNVVSLTVTCTASSLVTGTAPSITINATAPATPQTFTNVANVSSTNDSNGANNSGSAIVTVDPVQADLSVGGTAPAGPVAGGTSVVYQFNVTNSGPNVASNVTFTATIPSAFTFNSATFGVTNCTFVAPTVTCSGGNMNATTFKLVNINLTTGGAGTSNVTGSATATELDPNPANNSLSLSLGVTGNPLTVTNTSDGGEGSLRQALLDAQIGLCTGTPCNIGFNIGAGPFVIAPQSNLPAIGSSVVLDATTQPGYAGVPVIEIDGSSPSTGVALTLNGTGSTIRGFAIENEGYGIDVNGSGNSVESNYVGLTPAGGAAPNGEGIRVIGSNNTIGGSTVALRNVVSANTLTGIVLTNAASGNTIAGNYIGTNVAGTSAMPNSFGIQIFDGSDANVIGGALAGERNVISGNGNYGLYLDGLGTDIDGTVIRNNSVGLDATGAFLGNGVAGVKIVANAVGTRIFGNDIAANGNLGVVLYAGTGTTILGNSIHDNTNLGIDFDADGVTPNDAGDADSGANGRQNFPTLGAAALTGGGNVSITYSLDSSAATPSIGSVRIEVFTADAGGEGKTFVGGVCVAGNNFNTALSINAPAVTAGDPLVATATSYTDASCTTVADGTSEFSNVVNAANCTPPPVTITGPTTSCGGSVVLNAGAGFTSYLWSTGATTQTITVTPTSTTNYTVTITDNLGCTNSDAHTVTVNTPPTVTITGSTSSCAGVPITLDAGLGYATYLWNTGATTQTINVSPTSTTTYSVNVTDGNGCAGSDSHTVTVTANPTATITGPTSMCAGASVTLDAGSGYASYLWNTGATTQTILVSPTSTTTYSVTVGNGSCTAGDSHTVNVTAPPAATITPGGPTTFCAGGSVTLTASNGASWLWSNGATTQSIIVNAGGTFTVQVSNGTCSATSSPLTVTVNPTPVVNITGPTATCGGASVTLDAGAGFAQYLWSTGATTQTITVTPSSTTTFSVTVTDGNNCTAADTHTVTVSSNPVAAINAPAGICDNGQANASVSAQSGASYTWTVGNGTLVGGQGTPAITFLAGASGSVSLSVSVVSGSCTSNGTVNVPIFARPSASISAPATAVANQIGLVASVPNTAGATYNWSVANGTLTAGQGTNSITFAAGTSGSTDLTVSVTNGSCTETGAHSVAIDGGGNQQQADMGITKSAPAVVAPGANIVYTLAIANRGGVDASGVIVTDNFPAGTSFVSMNAGPWNCTRFNASIRCTGTAQANSSSTISLTLASPPEGGTIVNTADVTSFTDDADLSNNAASAATSVVAAPLNCATVPPSLTSPANGATVASPVTFAWSAVSGATQYELWINDTLAGVTASTTLTRPAVSGISTWFVVARLAAGCDPLSSATRTFTVPQSPGCNTNAATQITSPANGSTVSSPTTFTWTAVPNAIGYRLWLSVDGAAEYEAGSTDGATSLTIALPAGSIVATVQSLFAACPPVNSATITVTVPKPDPCAARATANLIAPANNSIQSSSAVTFAWSEAANANGYRVWVSIDGAAPAVLGMTTNATTLHGVIPRGDVTWFVESLYEGCASTESQPRRLTIPARNDCTDARPELLAPSRNSSTNSAGVTFAWSSVPGAIGYELWAAVDNGTPALLGTTTSTSLTHIVPPGRIDWFVRALVDRCAPRDSQTFRLTHTPPSACAANQRPTLIEPLDGAEVSAPVSFSWSAVPNASSYDLFIVRDGVMSVLATTTRTDVDGASLGNGHARWFVRANFAGNCSALDSAERALEVVPAAAACGTLDAPSIAAPGQISGGVPFIIQWTPVNGATSYQLQLAGNASFGAAQIVTTAGTSHALVRSNPGSEPLALYARVRAVDGRCTPPGMSPYGAATAIFILPGTGTEGSAPAGTSSTVTFSIPLGREQAGRAFVATPKQPWLTVSPATGIVGPNGTTITVTANTAGLPAGTSLGGVTVSVASSAGRSVAANDSFNIPSNFSVSMVTPVTPSAKDTPPPDALIIPAVAHAGGINSQFQSDVRVSNTSPQLITYQLTFTPSGDSGISEGQQTQFAIEPGRTIALDDILKSWFGTGGGSAMGTLEIRPLTQTAASTSSAALSGLANLLTFASSRTFNLTSNGTFGQYIPAIPFANFIGRDKLLSLQQIAQSNRYRTNLGIVEGSGNPVSLIVRVFGSGGQYLTDFNLDLRGGQHMQLNSFLRSYGVGNVDDGRVEIEVVSGDGLVTAYASVLDNETSDPLLVTPVTLSDVSAQKWVLPGVADLVSGFANWQTDMRLFNAGRTPLDVSLSFYSQAGGDPKVKTLTIPPGQVQQFDRALASLFETTNDGGAVHITTSEPAKLIATARTYNQTGTGTYGQFISAVTPSEAAGVDSRPLQLLQVEESDRFRSNVGLVEVTGKPVKLEISAIPPDAKFTAVTELELAPNEFRQLGSLLRSMGLSDTYNARVTVRVIEGDGRVTAYASVIDMLTNDPTYVPAQ